MLRYLVHWIWDRLAHRRGGRLLATLIITGLFGFIGGFADKPALAKNHWIPAYGILGGMALGLFGFSLMTAREMVLARIEERRAKRESASGAVCLKWALYLIGFPIALLGCIAIALLFIH